MRLSRSAKVLLGALMACAPLAASAGPASAAVTRAMLVAATSRYSWFGTSVDISGRTAVVGANHQSAGLGKAYVFTESSGAWHRHQVLVASDGAAEDFFGAAVAISGPVMAIGSPRYNQPGRVYIFTRTGTTWTQTAELKASDGLPGDEFGENLALSGGTLAVGAPGGDTNNRAYVFGLVNGKWAQRAILKPGKLQEYGDFGQSVALSGQTVLVGAPGYDGSAGATYVYGESGGAWAQQAVLTASDAVAGDKFGSTVALNGQTALIAAPDRTSMEGTVYAFTGSGSSWKQGAELTAPDPGTMRNFGSGIAMEPGMAAITTGSSPTGTAYVYRGSGASWTLTDTLSAPVGLVGFFQAVRLSGTEAIVGAPLTNHRKGAAFVFGSL